MGLPVPSGGVFWSSGPQMATLWGSVSDACLSHRERPAEAAHTGAHSPGRGSQGWTTLSGLGLASVRSHRAGGSPGALCPDGVWVAARTLRPKLGLAMCEPWVDGPRPGLPSSESSWVPILLSGCCYATSPPSPRNSLVVVCPGPPPEGLVPRSVPGTLPHPSRPVRPVALHVQDEQGGPSRSCLHPLRPPSSSDGPLPPVSAHGTHPGSPQGLPSCP